MSTLFLRCYGVELNKAQDNFMFNFDLYPFLDVSSEVSTGVRLNPPVSSDSREGKVCILLLPR
jgi:hypothetical protein